MVRGTRNRLSTSASSKTLHVLTTERNEVGRAIKKRLVLTPAEARLLNQNDREKEIDRLGTLSEQQKCAYSVAKRAWQDIPEEEEGVVEDERYEQDVLHGRTAFETSHAGEGGLTEEDIVEGDEMLLQGLHDAHSKLFRRKDHRTRRHRTKILVDAFAPQMERMTDAYVEWALSVAEEGLGATYSLPPDSIVQETKNVLVVDMFSAYHADVPMIVGDVFVASAYVRQGMMPVAPYDPKAVITIRALEVFRLTRLRCPRLGIQAFVRALCDMHAVPPRPYLSTQFSVAFDLYLDIRARVDARVMAALGRDSPNWRLKNACAPCMYRLEGEKPIPLPFLLTIDGNNSLSRFAVREQEEIEEDGTTRPGTSKEREDERVVPGDYYLPREQVDKWAKEGVEDLMKSFVVGSEEEDEGDGCTERWQNMKEDVTARAWGMYDETGFFPALCRHGFVLVVVDMVRSGELGKYGFSITDHLLRVLGELGSGYDIGCKFGKMIKALPVLGKLAEDNNFKSLVGSFHGCAHNRRCQLENLATYVKGMGLEDLEGCESFFSKSNALAATTRYATRFHRQQAITTYLRHSDTFDVYHGLSLMLASKYRRALKLRATLPELQATMMRLGVRSRAVFEEWPEKEKAHLRSLSKEPLQETLEMEYYQKLVNLAEQEKRLGDIMGVGGMMIVSAAPNASYSTAAQETRRIEAQRRHAMEVVTRTLAAVHDLELRLGINGIDERWTSGDARWEATATMVQKRRYQRALDHLEGLIIARIFELAKVNMAGTGYKMRKHIAKALQARSKAVKSAIERYNDAANSMMPTKPMLTWDQVVEYAFLADFDLLREGREDIRDELWARPAGRAAMDQHFKLLRAEEEITRLNLEIPRFVTRMVDEERFLLFHEQRLREEGKVGLAHQVGIHRMEKGRFTAVHMQRLVKLSKEPGFTASLAPGTAVSKELCVPSGPESRDVEMPDMRSDAPAETSIAQDGGRDDGHAADAGEKEDDEGEGGDGDVDGELIANQFDCILHISHDSVDTAH